METKVDIRAELKEVSPFLLDISKSIPQSVPNEYFHSFSAKMLKLAKESSLTTETELESIAPLLNQISKTPVQYLPKGYFTDFNVQPTKEPATIVQMRVVRKWVSYASAAVIAGVLITAGFVFNKKQSSSFDFEFYSKIDVPTALNQVSEDELQSYLNKTIYMSGADPILNIDEIELNNEENFKQISDDDLKEYLKENTVSFIKQKES